jgi:hypothetical protein
VTEEDEARFLFVAGQVHSLLTFALAAINTHPDPSSLGRHLQLGDTAATGRIGGEPIDESFLEGMADIAEKLKRCAERAEKRKETPRTPP